MVDTDLEALKRNRFSKKIKLSRHARRQMKWRKIAEKEVKEAIDHPEKLEDTIKGRKNAFKTIEGRLLKIT